MLSLRLLPVFILLLVPLSMGWAGGSKPSITFRLHVQVVEKIGDGSQVIPLALTQPVQTITVARTPHLAETHLLSATPTPDGGMMIQTSSTGARLLEEATVSNPGKIMVILLNGQVVYAPIIDIPLRSGRLLIPGPIPPELVAGLQARITQLKQH